MKKLYDHVKNFWFMHSAWALATLHFLVPSVNSWIDAHPKSMLAGIGTLVIARLVQGPSVKPT